MDACITYALQSKYFYLIFKIESSIIDHVLNISRCVGMADEGDSKSLVLITRVGSTPTTGIKNTTKLRLGGKFYAVGEGANSTAARRRQPAAQ